METYKKRSWITSERLALNFSLGLFITMVIVLCAFEWKTTDLGPPVDLLGEEEVKGKDMDVVPVVIREERKEIPKPKINVIDLSNVTPVDDAIKVDGPSIETNDDPFIEPELGDYGIDEEIAEPTPFTGNAMELPTFGKGEKDFIDYIMRRFTVPSKASSRNISGTVYVSFVVDVDGSVKDVEILKGLGFGIDEEAIRIVKKSPKWEPGRQGGRAAKVKMVIPIRIFIEAPAR